ncbi:hypothetical protein JL720_14082 [Aureococcus anophagefferens]|nr:hypothetical protein JL720_14082 [Aureococcus anophagefferens]
MLASGTPFFQEFHRVLQDDALGLLIKPMNIPVGYLFARFAAARSWTGRLRPPRRRGGPTRQGPVDGGHVEDLRVVHAPLRASAEDVAAAARTVGDGDDAATGPAGAAAPAADGDAGAARDGPSDATRWAFFRGETPEARLDWIAALTTLAAAREKGDDDGQLVAAATPGDAEVSQRLAPWRRRWFVLSEAGELLWYVSPPADDGEVPTGRFAARGRRRSRRCRDRATLEGVDLSEAAHRRRRFEFSVREARGERRTVKLTALSAHEGKQWVAKAAASLKVEPLPVVDDGGDDDAAGPTTEEPCDEEPVEKPRPPSRSPSERPRRSRARSRRRTARRGSSRCRRTRASCLLPEAAYGLLVPGAAAAAAWTAARSRRPGQRLVPLCDCAADLVYDALLASQAAGGARDSPQTVAQNTGLTKVLSLGKTESPRGDVDEDFLGKNLLGKIGGLKAYTSAKKGLTRAAADAGAVVSELLYEAQAKAEDATVRLIPLDFVESASPAERGEAAFVLKKAEVHTIRLGAKSKDEEEPEDTLSPLGAYPGGGRIFGNDSTFHQPLLSLEALREADGPPLPEARRHEADADGSDVEDAVALGLEDRPRKARRRPSSNGHPDDEGQRYECARVRVRRVPTALRRDRRKRDREHLWLESVVELVAAPPALADYLVGEGVFLRRDASVDDGCCARMEDRSWLRGLLVFAARSDDLDRRWAKEVRSFAPARFRDEWHVFWAHVDPIWDGFYDTAVSLRRWDRPAASGGLCGACCSPRTLTRWPGSACWPWPTRPSSSSTARPSRRSGQAPGAQAALAPTGARPGRRKDDEPGAIANLARRLSLPSTPAKPGGSLPPEAPADDGLLGDQPSVDRSPMVAAATSRTKFGVFGQLRELRQGLGKAQAKLHEYNTYLLQCRALHRWADPDRTWLFVAGLLLFAVTAAVLPLNYLFALFVLYFFSPPLFKTRGVSRATHEYFATCPC